MRFHASKVDVYKDDDAETIVGFYGADEAGKPRYLELKLMVRSVRGVCEFEVRVEVGRPKRVGRNCVASAALARTSFSVAFAASGGLEKIGAVEVDLTLETKAYAALKRGLQEVFLEGDVLHVEPVRRK